MSVPKKRKAKTTFTFNEQTKILVHSYNDWKFTITVKIYTHTQIYIYII